MNRTIVFDLVLKQPACPLLQAVMGGSHGIAHMFPTEVWLTSLTPDMKAYSIPEDELERLVYSFGGLYIPLAQEAESEVASDPPRANRQSRG